MGFDIAQYVEELAAGGAFTAEEAVQARTLLSKAPVAKRIEEGVLRQQDYSRNMADVKRTKDAATALIKANEEWKETAEAELAAAKDDLNAANLTTKEYRAEVDRIVNEYGLDPATLKLPKPAKVTEAKPVETKPNTSMVSKDDLKGLTDSMLNMPKLAAHLADLGAEHQELFGKPLKNAQALVEMAAKENVRIKDIWAREYKVDDRKAEIERTSKEEYERQIRADERQKVTSELGTPSARPFNTHSSVFNGTKPVSTPGMNEGVANAVAAHSAGKYRAAS